MHARESSISAFRSSSGRQRCFGDDGFEDKVAAEEASLRIGTTLTSLRLTTVRSPQSTHCKPPKSTLDGRAPLVAAMEVHGRKRTNSSFRASSGRQRCFNDDGFDDSELEEEALPRHGTAAGGVAATRHHRRGNRCGTAPSLGKSPRLGTAAGKVACGTAPPPGKSLGARTTAGEVACGTVPPPGESPSSSAHSLSSQALLLSRRVCDEDRSLWFCRAAAAAARIRRPNVTTRDRSQQGQRNLQLTTTSRHRIHPVDEISQKASSLRG